LVNESNLSFVLDTNSMLTVGYGVTVAGACNGSSSTNQTLLLATNDIMFMPNGTLYVANDDGRILVFEPNNRTAHVAAIFPHWPAYFLFDNKTSDLYISFISMELVYILPSYRTIPPSGAATGACVLTESSSPSGLAMDMVGNLYIASYTCNWITRWAPNATAGVRIAGSATGVTGGSSTLLMHPYCLLLDELNSMIYVADRFNHRIQRFPLDGSGTGVTVAGGNGAGNAPDQLYGPTEIYRSKSGEFLYICDSYNHRIQKWHINGTSGITVAGSSSGLSGPTPYLMNIPYAFAFDPDEEYIYVSDTYNNRVQRFILP
jgi:DNA-binding beta-propeller fold protein YncE